MHIKIKNFRCFKKYEIEVPDLGLILLEGANGKGKSTILNAIVYCLYGKVHGRRKITNHHLANKPTRVQVEYKQYKIIRETKPNRLHVTRKKKGKLVEYEDDAAQSIINKNCIKLTYEEFMASSFILGDKRVSIISMTPTEQANFIENIANTKSEEYKSTIKDALEKSRKQVLVYKTKIELLTKNIKEKKSKSRLDDVSSGRIKKLDCLKKSDCLKKLDCLKNRLDEYKKEKSILESEIAIFNEQAKERKLAIKELNDATNNVQVLKTEIDQLTIDCENINIDQNILEIDLLERMIDDLEKNINVETTLTSMIKQKCQYEKLLSEHENIISEKKRVIKSKMMSELEKEKLLEEKVKIKIQMIENRKKESDYNNFKSLKEKSYQDIIDHPKFKTYSTHNNNDMIKLYEKLKNYKEYFKCPHCDKNVSLNPGAKSLQKEKKVAKEIILDNDIKELASLVNKYLQLNSENSEIISKKEYNKTVNETESLSEKYDQIKKDLAADDMLQYNFNQLDNDKMLMLSEKLDSTISNIKKINDENKTFLDEDVDVDASLSCMTMLKDRLRELKSFLEKHDYYCEKKEGKEKLLVLAEKRLDKLKSRSCHNIENEFQTKTQTLIDLQEKIQNTLTEINEMKEIERYNLEMDELKKTRDEKKKYVEKLALEQDRILGLKELIKTCDEAKVLAMDNTINTINSFAKFYLDKMFIDSVFIQLIFNKKNNTTSKISLDTKIILRDQVYDDINELSSSERQRVELAFLLAINEMFHSPIVMLDEMFGNLDPTVNMEMLSFLKTCSTTKAFLIISHQCVQGLFDSIINV